MTTVESYRHRTGEHCASTAIRNLLAHDGVELSEGMVFGLASGLGFLYLRTPALSPSRVFHGRTATLESDFGLNTGVPLVDRLEPSDEVAWRELRASIDGGRPVMVSTDTFYLPYHHTTSHFPGHRCVVVGYDDATETVLIADRKFEELQRCTFEELRHARNAPDYPMTARNQYGARDAVLAFGRPLEEAIRLGLARNARSMLAPSSLETPEGTAFAAGIPAMRELAADFADWRGAEDWSWAARFAYQVIVKRGAGGSFFRSLYADFLRESAALVPGLAGALRASWMDAIAADWRALADLLRDQSERETCEPPLFEEAGRRVAALADAEERFFEDVQAFCA